MRAPSPPKFTQVLRLLIASLFLAVSATTTVSALEFGSFFKRKQLDAREISVNADEAVRIVSVYRKKHGLAPLTLDAKLTRIASSHAVKMAATDKVAHVVRGEGSFSRRLRDGNYDAAVASENIGGGYNSVAEAFDGWRKSPEHNKNMLRPDVTVMGIARADAAGSKYGTYWSLVLARPYVGPQGPPAGPTAGPPGLLFGR